MVAYIPPKQAGKYKAVASGAITNGKPVAVNSTGTVSQVADNSVSFGIGSNSTFESGNLNFGSYSTGMTFDSSNNKIVIVYADNGNSNYGTAVVGTVSGTSISFGTPVVYNSGQSNYNDCCFDSNANKVIVGYEDEGGASHGKARVGTVSGTSISFGTEATFNNNTTEYISMAFDTSTNIVIIAHRNHGNSGTGDLRLGLVSGTDISFGTNHIFETGSTAHVSVSFNSASNNSIVAFRDIGDGTNRGKFRWFTTNTNDDGSGHSADVSFGSTLNFQTGGIEVDYIDTTVDTANNKGIIVYEAHDNNQYGTAVVVTNNSTAGTAVVFESVIARDKSAVYNSDTGKVVIAYKDDTNSKLKVIEGTVSGTSISFGSATAVNNRQGKFVSGAFDSNEKKNVIGYSEFGNDTNGQANVVTSSKSDQNLTSENYIGIASGGTYADTAEATIDVVGTVNKDQSGLTAGQTYYVQNDGTLGTSADDPSVVAGTAISATEIIVKG